MQVTFSSLAKSQTNPKREALFGKDLVDRLNGLITRQVRLGFLIEQSPEETNRVALSREHVDHMGLPRPEITYNLSDYTKSGLAFAKQSADQIFARLRAQQFTSEPKSSEPAAFDWKIDGKPVRIRYLGAGHMIGTYRMGASKSDSVVNADQRSWDHENLYLIGSGVFPTSATANPTLTLAALALRTANRIINSGSNA